jgi:uncharacterized protein YndB with AHSA1/START domain
MKLFAFLAVLLSATCIAKSEVVAVSDSGFIVTNKVSIDAPANIVWQALINDIDKWWSKSHTWWGEQGKLTLDANAGGCFCEVSQERSAQHMQIVFVDPEKLLRMTGGLGPLQGMGVFGSLDWAFTTNETSTQITLTYRVQGFTPDGFAKLAPIVAQVQGLQLQGLVNYLNND